MVTVLVTSFLILVIISFAIYRWQRVEPTDHLKRTLPTPPEFSGLFAESDAEENARLNAAHLEEALKDKRHALCLRAADGDRETLIEAHQSGDATLYDEVLDALVRRAENAKQVFALASYVARSDGLPVNIKLAEAFTDNWKSAPDRRTTPEMLHVAALTGDAAFYQHAITLASQSWHEQRLRDIAPGELAQLIESEFWLIPSSVRNSGAGFLLKRELAKICRALSPAKNQRRGTNE